MMSEVRKSGRLVCREVPESRGARRGRRAADAGRSGAPNVRAGGRTLRGEHPSLGDRGENRQSFANLRDDEETGGVPLAGGICTRCEANICGRQRVISRMLAGKASCYCLDCLSSSLGSSPEQLCALVGGYLARRDCYRADWLAATTCLEGDVAACCPSRLDKSPKAPAWARTLRHTAESDDPAHPDPDLVVDAEEANCGDLMVVLMRSVRKIEPGQVLEITARDSGARADIPSWCRLTGNPLLSAEKGPERATYYIERRRI